MKCRHAIQTSMLSAGNQESHVDDASILRVSSSLHSFSKSGPGNFYAQVLRANFSMACIVVIGCTCSMRKKI